MYSKYLKRLDSISKDINKRVKKNEETTKANAIEKERLIKLIGNLEEEKKRFTLIGDKEKYLECDLQIDKARNEINFINDIPVATGLISDKEYQELEKELKEMLIDILSMFAAATLEELQKVIPIYTDVNNAINVYNDVVYSIQDIASNESGIYYVSDLGNRTLKPGKDIKYIDNGIISSWNILNTIQTLTDYLGVEE